MIHVCLEVAVSTNAISVLSHHVIIKFCHDTFIFRCKFVSVCEKDGRINYMGFILKLK